LFDNIDMYPELYYNDFSSMLSEYHKSLNRKWYNIF
jgi:hypothetical protein